MVASPGGIEGSLPIEQDAKIYLADLPAGGKLDFELAANRHAWLQVLRGSVELNGSPLTAGDAAAASGESALAVLAATARRSAPVRFGLTFRKSVILEVQVWSQEKADMYEANLATALTIDVVGDRYSFLATGETTGGQFGAMACGRRAWRRAATAHSPSRG